MSSYASQVNPNPNPTVNPLGKGQVLVTVRDLKNDCDRTIRVSQEEADMYISSRKDAMKNAEKKTWGNILFGTLLGGGAGALFGANSKSFLKEASGSKTKAALMGGLSTALFSLTGVALYYLLNPTSEKAGIKATEEFIDKHRNILN